MGASRTRAAVTAFVACAAFGACGSPSNENAVMQSAAIGVEGAAACSGSNVATATSTAAFVAQIAHGASYESLTSSQAASLARAAMAALAGDPSAAWHAGALGYSVSSLQTPKECLLVLAPTSTAPPGQATLIVRPAYRRDLVIEAPHVPFDFETDAEAAQLFDAVGARAVLIAGATRCASSAASGCYPDPQCSGESVESDPSHSVRSAFHAIHVAIATGASTTTNALQLHTNVETSLNGDLRVSNGTTTSSHRLSAFVRGLDGTNLDVRTCDDGNDASDGAYCGITNTQGIASNGLGTGNVCLEFATSASDRFLHLEQTSSAVWLVPFVTKGIESAFP
jgi:hypothetical protein